MSAVIDTPAAAPAAPAREPEMRMVDLVLIEESLTNPRKTFNQEKLQELADTIKAQGVLQPVLLRPLPGSRLAETFGFRRQGAPLPTHELVCGARRFRAARLAGLKTIPAMIRELSDHDARQMQHIENIQRQDVDKLEEAESFRSLMDEFGMTADAIGEQIKQSRSYVYAALKILDLCQAGRQLLREGKMDFSKGLLIARIPSEAQQLKAIKDLTAKDHGGDDRYGARAAAEHVRNHYMLALDKAPFSRVDAELLPEAGPCTTCPKRTGANPELFSDVKSADVCTDSPCFHKKEEAHALRLAGEAKAKGQNVIIGDEARELVAGNSYYHNAPKLKGYRRLDHTEDSPTDQPLRKIIGKQMKAEGIEPTKIENPRKPGEFIDCLPNEVANRLMKTVEAAANAEGAKAVTKEVQKMVDEKKAKAEARAKAQYEQAWRDQLLASAWAEIKTRDFECFSLEVHRYVLRREAASLSVEDAEAVAEILGLGKVGAHSAVIEQCKTTEHPDILHLLIIMQRASSASDYGYQRPANEGLMLVAGAALADRLPVVIRDVQAAAKAKYLSAPVESAAPKSASTPKPAAHATTTREGKGKGKATSTKNPAARAGATAPKTTAEEASAQIAAELARVESQNQAPAAQGNEGQAVAIAQPGTAPSGSDGGASEAVNQAPAAQGDEAPPAAPAPATPSPTAKASGRSKKGAAVSEGSAKDPAWVEAWPFPRADAKAPVAAPAPAAAVEIAEGAHVRVNAHVYAADKEAYAGMAGKVLGPLKGFKGTWRVEFSGDLPPGLKAINTFKAADLVVATEQAQAETAPPATATLAPESFKANDLVRVKQGVRSGGPHSKFRKCCGRVGVLGNSGTKNLTVYFGQRKDQLVVGLNAEDLEHYVADPLIGSQVRVLHAGMAMARNEYRWRTAKVVGLRSDGWLLEFTDKPGEPDIQCFGTEELEVIAP